MRTDWSFRGLAVLLLAIATPCAAQSTAPTSTSDVARVWRVGNATIAARKDGWVEVASISPSQYWLQYLAASAIGRDSSGLGVPRYRNARLLFAPSAILDSMPRVRSAVASIDDYWDPTIGAHESRTVNSKSPVPRSDGDRPM